MNVEEYNRCVEEFADGLYRFILKNIRDKDKASDIVQDSYEKLWLRIRDVSFAKAKSYLFATGYHTMIDRIRKEQRIENFEQLPASAYTADDQYRDLQEILHRALDRLTEVQRTVILLRDYEGYSYAEIGEITGLNESQVKVYIYRGRLALKAYIGSIQAVI